MNVDFPCINCDKREGTEKFENGPPEAGFTLWCKKCFNLLQRELWEDLAMSRDYNSGCRPPDRKYVRKRLAELYP